MIAFTDIVGMDLAKQALMLLAVDSALGGVVIPSAWGRENRRSPGHLPVYFPKVLLSWNFP